MQQPRNDSASVGVLLVSAHGARLALWWEGKVDDLERFELGPEDGGERDLRGPAHAHPRGAVGAGPGVHSSQQRDLHERRLLVHRMRELEHIARVVADTATARSWAGVVVAGDPRLTHAAAHALREAHVSVHESRKVLDHHAAHELVRELGPDVQELLHASVQLARHA